LVFATSPAVVGAANFCAWDWRFSYPPAANIMAMGTPTTMATTEKHSANSLRLEYPDPHTQILGYSDIHTHRQTPSISVLPVFFSALSQSF